MPDFGKRRSGRTTRIIDEAIQSLFTTGRAECVDHYHGESHVNKQLSRNIADRMTSRLVNEHKLRTNQDFFVCYQGGRYHITLIQEHVTPSDNHQIYVGEYTLQKLFDQDPLVSFKEPELKYMDTDPDGHLFIIPAEKKADWSAWCDSEDDNLPSYAIRVNGDPRQIIFKLIDPTQPTAPNLVDRPKGGDVNFV